MNQQATVLDELPDGVIIADIDNISYLNQEAWKLLGCQAREEDPETINDIMCIDVKSCSVNTPLDQLINFLVNVDKRIAKIDRPVFLRDMIEMATDDALLL